jgi:hypothetical protein
MEKLWKEKMPIFVKNVIEKLKQLKECLLKNYPIT